MLHGNIQPKLLSRVEIFYTTQVVIQYWGGGLAVM